MKHNHLFVLFTLFVVVLLTFSCKQTSDSAEVLSFSRTTSNATVPDDFDWSKLTYNQDYRIDPNTKEKKPVSHEYLSCTVSLPDSIERLPLKPCSEFTEAEKMLAFGVKNKVTDVVGDGVDLILMNYQKYFKEHKRAPLNIYQFPDYSFLKYPSKLDEYYNILKIHPEAVVGFSPVAKVPFTFNNPQFTKGQLYITQITDPEWLKTNGKSCGDNVTPAEYIKEKEKGFDTTNIVNLYYRVYGEDMTLAEGYLEFSLND